ncbi:MAG TPA: UvrD-helicase domain-containing protein, partial [Polyangiaceae bacterium]|nr:UvrD-helicase domain-containing protein [Polyangiaceae bacterium]
MTDKSSRFDVETVALRGKNLVEASAGTGKTHAITFLVVRLVLEEELQPKDIAVVTFTEAATAELRDRVRAQLAKAEQIFDLAAQGAPLPKNDFTQLVQRRKKTLLQDAQRLREAVENVDQAAISTIHGFCQRLLHDSALKTRTAFDVELVPDLNDLRDDVLYDFWHRRIAPSPELVTTLASAGVNLNRLRTLFDAIRRNPSLRVEPLSSASESDLACALKDALDAVRSHGRQTDLNFEAILRKNKTLGKLGIGADERPALFAAVEHIVDGTSGQLPANAACLFPQVAKELFKCSEAKLPPFFAAWQRYADLNSARAIALQHEFLNATQQELARRKSQQRVLGFEDLIQRLATAISGPDGAALVKAMRGQFKAVLIDEFQDTDPTQLQIFDSVFGNGEHLLFYIGDPKQAIYAFRGGDVFTYLAGRTAAKRHSMRVNWRSDPGVIAVVNQLFAKKDAFFIDGIGYEPITPRPDASAQFVHPDKSRSSAFELLFVRRKDQKQDANKGPARIAVARIVAADIVELLQSGARIAERPVREGDIAVLTRNNKQCRLIQAELVSHGVHCVLAGDQNVFGSDDATDLQFLLGALLDPSSSRDIKRALASRMMGQSGNNLAQLEDDPQAWNEWQGKFRHWGQLWSKYGFMRMFRELMSTAQSAETLLKARGGERALTNLLHLGELLHRASKGQHLGPAALTQWLREERKRAGKGKAAQSEYAEIRLESDESAVHILTVHKAKGLEYPIVYCPYLWDSHGGARNTNDPLLYHDDSQRAVLHIGLDEQARAHPKKQNEWENRAEERRVVYVGLTRAKHRCVVVWGGLRGWATNAATDLLHSRTNDADDSDGTSDSDKTKPTDAQLLEDLEAKAGHCAGDLNIHAVDWDFDCAPLEADRDAATPLSCREIITRVKHWARTDSFSGLIKPRSTEDPTERAPAADEALVTAE